MGFFGDVLGGPSKRVSSADESKPTNGKMLFEENPVEETTYAQDKYAELLELVKGSRFEKILTAMIEEAYADNEFLENEFIFSILDILNREQVV